MSGKKREAIDLDTLSREIRRQLSEQQICMDMRTEGKLSLLSDFTEFFKKRGEVELEYAKALDKLVDRFERSAKRNSRLDLKSSVHVWNSLLSETRRMAKEHVGQAEAYSTEMTARFDLMSKDVQVLTKRCKDINAEIQDSLLKDLKELNEQSKAYQYSCLNCSDATTKLAKAREKTQKANPKRRDKLEEKERERERLFLEAKFRQLKFRNEFILSIGACNAVTQKYFSNDILDVIETVDYDYHDALSRAVAAYREMEYCLGKIKMASVDTLEQEAKKLDFIADRSSFMQENQSLFTPPPVVQFIPYSEDEPSDFMITEGVEATCTELNQKLSTETTTLTAEIDETAKTLDHMNSNVLGKYKIVTVAEAQVLLDEMVNAQETSPHDLSKSASFERGLSLLTKGSQILTVVQRGKKPNLEFTLEVFHRKLQKTNKLAKASAKLGHIERGLTHVLPGDIPGEGGMARKVPSKERSLPKLFKGNLVEYVQATSGDIPLIVRSCVVNIEENGIKMEGIFRVPGPSQTVDDLRRAFEDGVNPLISGSVKRNKTDFAAIASVLKQYFRELEDPLFPQLKYSEFIECARIEDVQGRCDAIKEAVSQLNPIIIKVMRFLFSFLYKVASEEPHNKMSSANLATVFGPTLTRAPSTVDAKQLHHDVPAVNVLIQTCIENHSYIFGEDLQNSSKPSSVHGDTSPVPPVDVDGRVSSHSREPTPVRETSPKEFTPPPPYVAEEVASEDVVGRQVHESPEDDDQEDDDEDTDSDNDTITLTVKAVFDYVARNEKELSFNQGDLLHVIEKTPDNNWWDGMREGKRGFVPVAYVEIFHPSGSLTSLQSPAPPNRKSSITSSPVDDPLVESVREQEVKSPELKGPDVNLGESMPPIVIGPTEVCESPTSTEVVPPVGTLDLKESPRESPPPLHSPDEKERRLSGTLSPVSEEDKIKAQMRGRTGTGVSSTLKAKMAAFESSKNPGGLSASVGTNSGHQRSISVDDSASYRRLSEGHGALSKKFSNMESSPQTLASTLPAKPKVMEKPNVKEMAQQGAFVPMPHGQYPVASPLQRSVLLRQTEGPPAPPEEQSKKKGTKPPVLARPPRLPSKRDSVPQPKPKNESLSAELRAVMQAKTHPQ